MENAKGIVFKYGDNVEIECEMLRNGGKNESRRKCL